MGNENSAEIAAGYIENELKAQPTVYDISASREITGKDTQAKSDRLPYLALKRAADIVCSLIGLVILSPFLAILAIIIPLESGGFPLYAQKRIGINGKEFKLYKLRSMYARNKPIEEIFTPEQLEQYRREFKVDDDPRVTRVGRIIRKYSIDELPQLINILAGDLSIIGPRPIVKQELEKYGTQAEEFLSVKPGLTGYWQAYARNNAGYEDGRRQRMELYYIENRSLRLDVKIFFRTVLSVLCARGAK
ncbi:MAG: sugar transferase [Oscillospiraceae bacterium]|jgi:lipopolysaccharide/colanic/teichoic acid biosynthesis glycosyltransferase|nr:sugar transferase [Oscillospiraceae bacterium]